MTDTDKVAAHYTSGTLLQKIEAALAAMGVSPPFDSDVLAPVDEFHIGGRQATVPFFDQLELTADATVLDLGCGLGGPARFAARVYGAHVAAIDLTDEFVQAAWTLNQWTGLQGHVFPLHGSILELPYDIDEFDIAYMIHVGMNITDKIRLAAQVARVLKPGGRFGIYDVMRLGEGDLVYPVPWAATPEQSALDTPATYRAALEGAGFEILSETDRSGFAKAFFARLAAAQASADGPPPLGLHLVMGADTATKVRNMVANIAEGRIAPVEIIARLRL